MRKAPPTLIGLVVLFCTACNGNTNLQTTQPVPGSEPTNTGQATSDISTLPTIIPYPYPVKSTSASFYTPYPAPIKTSYPTSTSLRIPTSTPFLPPSPIPIVPTIISRVKLDCIPHNSFAKCRDDTLGIVFEYLVSWGEIEAVLRTSQSGVGYAYNYNFIGITAEHASLIRGGGRSKDFSEARGGTFTDFRGYGDKSYQDRCNDIKNFVPICREIKPNVILTMHFPNAQFICDPAPGRIPYPIVIIEINLPDNPLVNGFVFMSPFLSEELTEDLKSDKSNILGYAQATVVPTKCDSASQAEFDNLINDLIESIITGLVDDETKGNIQQLEYIAASVIFQTDG